MPFRCSRVLYAPAPSGAGNLLSVRIQTSSHPPARWIPPQIVEFRFIRTKEYQA